MIVVCAFAIFPLWGATVIKLGSLAPIGSPWDDALREIGREWARLSGNTITLRIYSGGVAGDEIDMTRKMRLGQLCAAGVTGVALCRIHPPILTMQLPMLIRNNEEFYYVLDKMKKQFENGLEEKGFIILVWNLVGWAHFFSKIPIVTPTDLQKTKLFVYGGDADAVQTWQEMGFRPIPLSITDLMPSLQSGMVEAFTTTPLSAASYQWFGLAPNMCDMQWAPLLGGIIITKSRWNALPADLRPQLRQATEAIAARIQDTILAADRRAVEIMKQHNLKVTTVTPDAIKQWQAVVERGINSLIGKTLDRAIIDEIRRHLADFRTIKGKVR